MFETESAVTRRSLPIEFSASGSEYFRIWIVNLLLTVLTLGFYLPFAKARRLRYFYANTLVDGQALAFHGDPWKMLRGYVLMLVLFGAYAASGHVSGWVALGAFVVLALLWPALWRSSLRFRLGNTSWRGLRFGFEGSLGGAYKALLPMFLPAAIMVASNAILFDGVDMDDANQVKAAMEAQLPWMAASTLLMLLIFPLSLAWLKRYQHLGYRYAMELPQFRSGVAPFYWLGLKTVLLGLLLVGASGALVAILVPATMLTLRKVGPLGGAGLGAMLLTVYLALLCLIQSYAVAKLQNLVWNATASLNLGFDSRLGVRALTGRLLKNLLLTVLSLGLYRPFAVVNTMRMRLQAVSLQVDGDIEQWRAGLLARPAGAGGEMSGDFFGIDVGL